MGSDYQETCDLFTKLGIGYTAKENSDKTKTITCMEGGSKIKGYIGFYAVFQFDRCGIFIEMGAYE